jgi:NNP family nitrate/nitrite transporter-like MFS transporter
MCWLYIGTFGSFIGYSAAFPLLTSTLFPQVNPLQYAFVGPLVSALARVAGGYISDKLGGARVTVWTFAAMIVAVVGVLQFLPHGANPGSFAGFFGMFLVLFACTGVGNASTFRMIPVIFLTLHQRAATGQPEAVQTQAVASANKEAAAVLGFTSAIAAYGAFFIPKAYGTSIALTGSANGALWCFIGYYISCIVVTWWFYARKRAAMPC